MHQLKPFLKWGTLSLCVLLVLLSVAWVVARTMYPTEAQREAIAELESLPEHEGENAFPLLWSLGHAVPDSELEEVMNEDVRRFSETPVWPEPDEGAVHPNFESARADYPDLSPSAEDRRMFCGEQDENCLEKVRRDLDAYNALMDRNRALLDRTARLHDYEYVRSPFPPRQTAPFPSYQNVTYLRTRHAVAFASGSEREAIAAVCREIQTWRRLSANADVLIDRLFGLENASKRNGTMLANMLAQWPVDEPLPAPCASALSPPELADVSICHALHGEFARVAFFGRNLEQYDDGSLESLMLPVLFDAEATLGRDAENYWRFCEESAGAKLLADRRPIETSRPSIMQFDCVGNYYGCAWSANSNTGYADYQDRALDHGARLRVLGTLAWMRRHGDDGRSPKALLEARPDALKSPERDIVFGPEGQTLRVPLYQPEYGSQSKLNHWSIPLPPPLFRTAGD